ncbi:MAG: cytochrome c oxidase assembly factor Coa1 family protein [Planctomycetota bacterium]|nr:cytochrome c oxidase assembly factor Coa1 family protein [Planctomycetota bacterium]
MRHIVALIAGAVVLLVVLLGGCIGGMVYVGIAALRSHSSVQPALAQASSDPRVTAVLGTPVEQGFMATGNVAFSGATQTANLSIALRGPLGKGKLVYSATRVAGGQWLVQSMRFEPQNGTPVELIAPNGPLLPPATGPGAAPGEPAPPAPNGGE